MSSQEDYFTEACMAHRATMGEYLQCCAKFVEETSTGVGALAVPDALAKGFAMLLCKQALHELLTRTVALLSLGIIHEDSFTAFVNAGLDCCQDIETRANNNSECPETDEVRGLIEKAFQYAAERRDAQCPEAEEGGEASDSQGSVEGVTD